MQVADHFSAVKRRFESRAMPAYEKPPAKLVDIYFFETTKKETMETLYVFIVSYMSIKEYLRA